MKYIFLILFVFYANIILGQEQKFDPAVNKSYQYALIEASRQKMIGNISEAIVLYNECIKANPKCDVAYYELGTIFSVLKENKKAEVFLEKAYEINPGNLWYGLAYAGVMKMNNKPDKAIDVLKKIRKNDSDNELTVNYEIAEIYSETGKYKKALRILNSIEKEKGISEIMSFTKMEIYKKKGDFQLAESELRKLIQHVPDFAGYRIIMAEYYLERKDTLNAIKAYENACELDSSNILAIANLSDLFLKTQNYEKSLFYLSKVFMKDDIDVSNKIQTLVMLNRDRLLMKQNSESIEKLVLELLKKYPDNINVKTVAYDFYNGIENSVYAFALIKQIINVKKDVYIIWQQALYNANMIENYDEMITIGQEALKYFPNKAELFLMVGMAYFQKQNYEDSFEKLNEGYAFISDKDEIKFQYLILLAESSYKTNRKNKAFSYYDELIKIDPGNNIVKNNYSYFLALEGIDLEKAKKLSNETIEIDPENGTYLDTYGWILFTMGNYEEAKVYIERALKFSDQNNPEILFHYAEILFKTGDKIQSKIFYKQARDFGFDMEIIKQKLNDLDFNE